MAKSEASSENSAPPSSKFFDQTELDKLIKRAAEAFIKSEPFTLNSDEALRFCMLACSYLGERKALTEIMPPNIIDDFTIAAHYESQILLTATCPNWAARVFPAG